MPGEEEAEYQDCSEGLAPVRWIIALDFVRDRSKGPLQFIKRPGVSSVSALGALQAFFTDELIERMITTTLDTDREALSFYDGSVMKNLMLKYKVYMAARIRLQGQTSIPDERLHHGRRGLTALNLSGQSQSNTYFPMGHQLEQGDLW